MLIPLQKNISPPMVKNDTLWQDLTGDVERSKDRVATLI